MNDTVIIRDFELGQFNIKPTTNKKALERVVKKRVKKAQQRKIIAN